MCSAQDDEDDDDDDRSRLGVVGAAKRKSRAAQATWGCLLRIAEMERDVFSLCRCCLRY